MLFNTINCRDTTSNWLWSWLPHRLSKRQSLSTTVLFRTPYPNNHIPPSYEMTPGFKPFTVSLQYEYGKKIWKKTTFLEVIITQLVFSLFSKELLVANQTFSRDQQTVIYLFCRILWLKSWKWMKLSSRRRRCGKRERTLVNTGIAVKSKDIRLWVGLQTRKASDHS